MITKLRSYSSYKDTPLPWLQELPANWNMLRGKALFRPIDIRSRTGDEPLLTVSSARGVVRREEVNVTMFKAESYSGFKLCWPGDLVINSLWAWAGGLGFSAYHGIVSSAYSVFRLREGGSHAQKYYHYLIRSPSFQWELQTRSKGIWISRLQITDDNFLNILFPFPPLPEQRAIVKFLDWAERRVRFIVAARKRRIQLLGEYRQALISDAVTGKFDVRTGKPYPSYKDSGVPWLGKVPEGWEIVRLKRLARLAYGDSLPANERQKGEVPVYGSNGPVGFHDRANTVAPVIIVGRKGSFGKIQYSAKPVFAIDTTFFIDKRYTDTDLRWLFYMLSQLELDRSSQDSAVPGLDREEAYQKLTVLPPFPEQRAIAEYLDRETEKIDAAIEKTKESIALWEELRETLISDVVTGKLDVREVAKRLPEEEPELEEKVKALDASLLGGESEESGADSGRELEQAEETT